MQLRKFAAPMTAVAAAGLFIAGVSATRAAPAPTPAPPPKPSVYTDYHPNMSDMMTMLVQPRHIKLGLGLRSRNWTYAAYEASELRGAFRRITASMPGYEGKDTVDLVTMIAKPLDDMVTAARARDPAKADAAYAELTATCNMCHEAQGRTYIVIQAPTAAMFPDQNFRAP